MFQTTIHPNNRFSGPGAEYSIGSSRFSFYWPWSSSSSHYLRTFSWLTNRRLVCPLCVAIRHILLTLCLTKGQTSKRRSLTTRIFLALVPYSLYLFTLSLIPLPEGGQTDNLLTTALSRLVVLGTFIYGLLSGLGAARNSWEFLPSLNRRQWDPTIIHNQRN